ncbi:MAG TPA: diguanylate cyclase [Polyangiaceae bacterium]|nr:diguanylate cyclase [Polyangiaceae bacterium]
MPPHATDSVKLSSSPPIAERAGRVLVVEPETERRADLRQLLEQEGYDSVFLPDGDELLRLTAEYEPDLILLAADLPGMSGLELVGDLRAMDPRNHYPVILLGTAADEEEVARGLLAGADDFVPDPERQQELRARIRVQLRNKRFYDALERVRNERDNLRRDSQTDPLTGLLNRRSLQAEVTSRCAARERFGILFMDLDHFKSVNDRFGHEMGDRVLVAVASVLKTALRPGDVVGRYGGEEFVGIVAGAGPESARLVAERLRRAIEAMLPPKGGPAKLTISIGTTVFDPRQSDERTEELLHRADMALYAAKRTGRNRVVLVAPGQSLPAVVEQDTRGSASMGIPFTTPPEKPQSSVLPINDVPVLPLERLRSG